ncbi:MAG: HemK/PrmC family methyltransferase, partial [Thiotrichaceae bacterium]
MSYTVSPISTLLQQASQQLEKVSDSPLLDSQLLLAAILNKDRSYLMAWPEVIPSQQEAELFQNYLLQRKEEIPVAYILGCKEFWSMPFKVTPDVLIPRPETELLVEQVLETTSHLSKPKILELGTGSGAIAIALGKELPEANIIATDLS